MDEATITQVTERVRSLWLAEQNDEVAHLLHAAYERLVRAERAARGEGE